MARRFGHLSHRGIKVLEEKKMVTGLPNLDHTEVEIYEVCMRGKQIKVIIPKRGYESQVEVLNWFTTTYAVRSHRLQQAKRSTSSTLLMALVGIVGLISFKKSHRLYKHSRSSSF